MGNISRYPLLVTDTTKRQNAPICPRRVSVTTERQIDMFCPSGVDTHGTVRLRWKNELFCPRRVTDTLR